MKIIFFDIDGTLICGGSELMSESTKEAIRIARANGHICMINTGYETAGRGKSYRTGGIRRIVIGLRNGDSISWKTADAQDIFHGGV